MRTSRTLLSVEVLETRTVMSTVPSSVVMFLPIAPPAPVQTAPVSPVVVGTLPGGGVSPLPAPAPTPIFVGKLPGGVVSPLPAPAPGGWGEPGYVVPVAHHHQHHHHHHQIALHGEVGGYWNSEFVNPDVGATHVFQGSGNVKPLGAVEVQGKLSLPGFIQGGKVTGTFTLTNAKGTVEVKVSEQLHPTGVAIPAIAPFGQTYDLHFTIVGGTGAYRGATGSGQAVLTERPALAPPPPLPGHASPQYMIAPNFSLQFGGVAIHFAATSGATGTATPPVA